MTVLNYGLPILVILFSIALAINPIAEKYPALLTAITYDLVLTAPVLFLLISLKSKVAKFKAVPFFIGGMGITTLLIPESGQAHLNDIKIYVLPIVEIVVLSFLTYNILKGVRTFRANANRAMDFHAMSKISVKELLGDSKFAIFLSSEIAVFYYAFFCWKPVKVRQNDFTKYKENASLAIAGAFLVIVGIETYAFHILLLKWSPIAAWILTGLSMYTAFGIIAHIKALLKRPSILTNSALTLKNGLIADINIPLKDIQKIEGYSKEMNSENLRIGNLGISKESANHNIAIHFSKPQTIEKMYGFTELCDVLLIHMDEKNRFLSAVNLQLEKFSS